MILPKFGIIPKAGLPEFLSPKNGIKFKFKRWKKNLQKHFKYALIIGVIWNYANEKSKKSGLPDFQVFMILWIIYFSYFIPNMSQHR